MLVREVRSLDHVVRLADRVRDPGFRVVRWPDASDRRSLAALAFRLEALGYAVMDADRAEHPRLAGRRHVAMLTPRSTLADDAATWVRRVGLRSARGHLLVLGGEATGSTGPLRERAPAYEAIGGWVSRVPRALGRARRSARRGRRAAEKRWLRAAVAEARRGANWQAAGLAHALLLRRLVREGGWGTACRTATDEAARTEDVHAADQACRWASSLALHVGRFAEAESIAAAAGAAAIARGHPVSGWVWRRTAEIRLVQGRTEDAAAALDRLADADPRGAAWRGLCAWFGDDAARWPPPAEVVGRPIREAALLRAAAVLRRGVARSSRACRFSGGCASDDVDALMACTRRYPRWVLRGRGLIAAGTARALDEIGRRDAAVAIRDAFMRHDLSPMQAVASGVPPSAGRPALPVSLRRAGGGIVRRLTEERMTHLTCAIPVLLERVAEAEDDAAALSTACAWARQQPGVSGAAIVGGGGEWIRSDGVVRDAVDVEPLRLAIEAGSSRLLAREGVVAATAPIRYAGAPVGAALLTGDAALPETLREVASAVAAVCGPAVRARLDELACARRRGDLLPELVGRSPGIVAVREAVARAAGTSFPVLIDGESGTGKELVARGLHRLSARRDRAFCPVNCAALTDELVEAELFGHARGAFTGAAGPRAGLFEEAHLGTLFMDEVSELSPRAQAKVLRALQEGEIRRLGENVPRRVDVRIVAATNRPLADEVGRGGFRDDLMFRLAVARVRLPPLRDRVEDLPELAQLFWTRAAAETGTRARLGPDALARLAGYRWPGNVRELQNVMAALVLAAPRRGQVGARTVARVLGGGAEGGGLTPASSLRLARRAAERRQVVEALARNGGRRAAAARELGLSRQGLAKAVRRLGLGRSDQSAGVA